MIWAIGEPVRKQLVILVISQVRILYHAPFRVITGAFVALFLWESIMDKRQKDISGGVILIALTIAWSILMFSLGVIYAT